MSQIFVPHYEFNVSADKSRIHAQVVICAAGEAGSDGEGFLRFWVEKRHPAGFDFDSRELIPAHTETILGRTVRSIDLVRSGDIRTGHEWSEDRALWLLRSVVIALARGEVAGRSASDLLYDVLYDTCVKPGDKWLKEAAPEWWKMVDPDRQKETA